MRFVCGGALANALRGVFAHTYMLCGTQRSMELCIVMEFADGGDLNDKVEKAQKSKRYLDERMYGTHNAPLLGDATLTRPCVGPRRRIWAYFLQLLEGVICLHEHKVLHRDLKTANCFLTKDGRLKIGDLNVSKLARMGLVKTQIGTPYYMSPEIWQNRPYNDKSDIWSIGCILYEMCALRPPFRGRDLEDLAKRVQAGYYPRIPSQYSSDLDTTVRQLLAQDPRRRPSAKQVLELPQVKKRLQEHKKMLMGTLISELQSEGQEMLATIHVPRNIRRITNQLPKPAYPDMRPKSPSAWPVTAEGRAREIDRQARGLQPTIEEDEPSKATSHSDPHRSHRGAASAADPASLSDPMQRGSGSQARAAARAQVVGGNPIPSVRQYDHHRRRGDARSVASGYSHDNGYRGAGGGGYGAGAAAGRGYNPPSSRNYGGAAHQPRSVAPPRVAHAPHAALPTVNERKHGVRSSSDQRSHGSHRSGGGRSHKSSHERRAARGVHASPLEQPRSQGGHPHVRNPYSHGRPSYKQQGSYASNYQSPYGQRAIHERQQQHVSPYQAPQRYSRYSKPGGYGGGVHGGAAARARAGSQASVASSVYGGYRNNGAYSHRSNASRPSWWG